MIHVLIHLSVRPLVTELILCLLAAAPVRTRSPSPPLVHSSTMEIATPLLEMGFTWPHIRNAILSTGL